MSILLRMRERDPAAAAEVEEKLFKPSFHTYGWRSFKEMVLPPRECYFGDHFALGGVYVLQGPGGVGKSRITTSIAMHQVLQLPWCGFSTGVRPLKWLMLGNENSMHRMQADVRRMSKGLTEPQLQLLDEHIRMQALEAPEDSDISLGSDSIRDRWAGTLLEHTPDILVIDPWGEVLYGDANDDEHIRLVIRTALGLLHGVNPNASMLVIHHSRTGTANLLQATGYDAMNYGKGSKALQARARAVLNIAPGDPEDSCKLVMSMAKDNDNRRFDPFGLIMDPDDYSYHVDDGFSLDAWRDDVEGKRTPTAKITVQDVVDALSSSAFPVDKKVLAAELAVKCACTERTAAHTIVKALQQGYAANAKDAPNSMTLGPKALKDKGRAVTHDLKEEMSRDKRG